MKSLCHPLKMGTTEKWDPYSKTKAEGDSEELSIQLL